MVGWCYVPKCTTGLRPKKNAPCHKLPSMFKAPKNKHLRLRWEKNIGRKDRRLKETDFVCEKHFHPEEIIREWRTVLSNGDVNVIKRIRPVLKPNTVPTIFPDFPPHYRSRNTRRRKSSKVKGRHATVIEEEVEEHATIIEERCSTTIEEILDIAMKEKESCPTVIEEEVEEFPAIIEDTNKTEGGDISIIEDEVVGTVIEKEKGGVIVLTPRDLSSDNQSKKFSPEPVLNKSHRAKTTKPVAWSPVLEANNIELPSLNWGVHVFINEKVVTFIYLDSNYSVRKAVKIPSDLKPKVYINGSKEESVVSVAPLTCNSDVEHFLRRIDELTICNGIGLNNPTFSSQCCRIVESEGSCDECLNEYVSKNDVQEWESMEKERYHLKNMKINAVKQKVKRLECRVDSLKAQLKFMINKCRVVGAENILKEHNIKL